MDFDLRQVKQEMCDVGNRIWQKGFCAGNEGNHSVRISADRVLCTPTGISKGFLHPDDLCVVDMAGHMVETNVRGRNRTSEVLVHLAIYKMRPDVRAVIHSHPPHATAFAIADIPLPEGIHPEAEVFLGKVPTAKYATPSTQALPDSITALIGPETNTVLMGNHGAVCFSSTLIDTYYKLEILDAYCRILILCKQLGRANTLNPQQMTELLQVKKKFGMQDPRLACAPQGCIGEDNEPFFAMFENTQSAQCECHSTKVEKTTPATGVITSAPVEGSREFDDMVKVITQQILTAVNGA